MKNFKLMLFIAVLLLITACNANKVKIATQEDFAAPPVAKKIAQTFQEFGNERVDNYYWIRDNTNQDVLDYLTQENDYTNAVMGSTKELQEKIYEEILGRIKQEDQSYPTYRNGYHYYSRTESGKQYTIYCRKKETLDAPEEIIFDVNKMAEGKKTYSFRGGFITRFLPCKAGF